MVGGTKTPGWSKLQAEDLMIHDRIAVTAETTIEEAVKMMEEKRSLNPPVKQNGGWPTP
jgi:CBS domain-containing protein